MNSDIKGAVERLRQGGVVAFPTDTVYGLGASALNEMAIRRVYEVKQRPRHLPLPLLLAEIKQIGEVCIRVPGLAWLLAERFLPGGLTLVLFRAPHLSPLLSGGGEKLGVRVPAHPIPRALVQGLGAPITGTSANLSGQPSPTTVKEVKEQLGDRVDFVVEGVCPGGNESTVIDLTLEEPVILREGAVSRQELGKAIQEMKVRQR